MQMQPGRRIVGNIERRPHLVVGMPQLETFPPPMRIALVKLNCVPDVLAPPICSPSLTG